MQDSRIHHKFLNETFFYPTWEVDTLILGTFNPQCGENTDYFYGRRFNNFWRTIEKLLDFDEYYFQENLDRKIDVMTKYKFGCTDVIKSIKLKDLSNQELICGKGYSDQVLFTKRICDRDYNFDVIIEHIKNSKVKRIIYTWGERINPKEFKLELERFKSFCKENEINFVEHCPSISGRFRSQQYKNRLQEFYSILVNNETI